MQAMRTGAWTVLLTAREAAASAEAPGSTFPIACKTGRLNITPAPFRNVRRGSIQFFCIILFSVKSIAKRKAEGDLFDQCRGAIIVFLQRLHRAIYHAFVEAVEFAPVSVAGHFA